MKIQKYNVGDQVIISKVLTSVGGWCTIEPIVGNVVCIKDTPTFGFAYSIEIDGKVQVACYWEEDIDGKLQST